MTSSSREPTNHEPNSGETANRDTANRDSAAVTATFGASIIANPRSPSLLGRVVPTFLGAAIAVVRSPIAWFAAAMLLYFVAVYGTKFYRRYQFESLLHDVQSTSECIAHSSIRGYLNPITMRSVMEVHVHSLEIKHDANWERFLPRLSALPELTSLTLDTGDLTVKRGRWITRHASAVRGLHLANCRIESGALLELQKLPEFDNLSLRQLKVSQENLDEIAGLTNLERLGFTNVTSDNSLRLFAGLNKLTRVANVNILGAHLDSEDLQAINRMPRVSTLWLQSCKISAEDLVDAIQQNHKLYVNIYARDWSIPDADRLRATLRVNVQPDGAQAPLLPSVNGNYSPVAQTPVTPNPVTQSTPAPAVQPVQPVQTGTIQEGPAVPPQSSATALSAPASNSPETNSNQSGENGNPDQQSAPE